MINVRRFTEDAKIHHRSTGRPNPLVSVIMPAFRLRADNLTIKSIESVLGQTFGDFEFIILDDGSNDGLYDELLKYHLLDDRITIVRHEKNSGLPAIRTNQGLLMARADLVTYQFEDDSWKPTALRDLYDCRGRDDEAWFVYGIAERKGTDLASKRFPLLGDGPFDYGQLRVANFIANNAVLHPRSLLKKTGMYDPHLLMRRLCDYDLWLRFARVARPIWCSEIVSTVRVAEQHSLGATVYSDTTLVNMHMAAHRNLDLSPASILDYDIAATRTLPGIDEVAAFRREYVAPFVAQHPDFFPREQRDEFLVARTKNSRLLVAKPAFSTTIDVTLGNFTEVLDQSSNSQVFVPETNIPVFDMTSFDNLVLFRTVSEVGTNAADVAHSLDKAVTYLMDDHMLKFHELGPEFDYLAPGSYNYHHIETQIKKADVVICCSEAVKNDVAKINPRVLRLETNILSRHIEEPPVPAGTAPGRRKYAILSSQSRQEEIAQIWDDIVEFAEIFKDSVEFYLWGFDVGNLRKLACPTYVRGFTSNYDEYLRLITQERFDFVLCPLDDSKLAKRGKSPVKYLEATAAGAVLITSDTEPYSVVRNGIKVPNGLENAWREALFTSMRMPEDQRRAMVQQARTDIKKRFTTESQLLDFVTTFGAVDLHAALKSRHRETGRAGIAYYFREHFLGGATLHLLYHARLISRLGFNIHICVPMDTPQDCEFVHRVKALGFELHWLPFHTWVWPTPRNEKTQVHAQALADFLGKKEISLVHGTPFSTEWVIAARGMNVPIVVSIHQNYTPPDVARTLDPALLPDGIHCSSLRYAREWKALIKAPVFTMGVPVDPYLFDLKATRGRGTEPTPLRDQKIKLLVSGTVQPRKAQLQAIQAVGALVKEGYDIELELAGYTHFFPDYIKQCEDTIKELGIEDRVTMLGFVNDMTPHYSGADILLCCSEDESMPQAVINAMAAGVPVVVTPVGGVNEIILDGYSGIILGGDQVDNIVAGLQRLLDMPFETRMRLITHAHETIHTLCREKFVGHRLVELYQATFNHYVNRRVLQDLNRRTMQLEVNIQGTFGKALYIYGIAIDGQAIELPKQLPPGWAASETPGIGRFIVQTEGSTSPLILPISITSWLSFKVLATRISDTMSVRIGPKLWQWNVYHEVDGGEFRTVSVHVSDMVDGRVNSPVAISNYPTWTASEAEVAGAPEAKAIALGSFDEIRCTDKAVECRGWAIMANAVIIASEDGKSLATCTASYRRSDIGDHFGTSPTSVIGWETVFPLRRLGPGLHKLQAVIKGERPGQLTKLPGNHFVYIDDYEQIFTKENLITSIANIRGVTVQEQNHGLIGSVDSFDLTNGVLNARGWFIPALEDLSMDTLLITNANGDLIDLVASGGPRPDVVEYFGDPSLGKSGWIAKNLTIPNAGTGPLSFYLLNIGTRIAFKIGEYE